MQPSTSSTRHVVIIGGGIAGLSTAYYLQGQAAAKGIALRYTVLEAAPRWGGHILTETVETDAGRFVAEAGPDSFITQKPWGVQLARELGLADRLLGTNDAMRKVYVLNRGKPTPMPDGVLLIVPTKLMPFALSPLISPLGKLRMGLDLLIPPSATARMRRWPISCAAAWAPRRWTRSPSRCSPASTIPRRIGRACWRPSRAFATWR